MEMSWTKIDKLNGAEHGRKTPLNGVRLTPYKHRTHDEAGSSIIVNIGGGLARRAGFAAGSQRIDILIGSGEDHGSIAIAASSGGEFKAVAPKNSNTYRAHVNRATMAGLFQGKFEIFSLEEVQIVPAGEGGSTFFHFTVPDEMFADD